MKKVLLIIILCLFVVGCNINNNLKISEKSNIKVENKNVTLSIKENTLTNEGATFILKNYSDKDIEYGTPYELEIYQNDTWYKIDVDLYFIMPSYILIPDSSKELEINWSESYGKLPKGKYRLLKNINTEDDSFYVECIFEIK